MRGLWGFYSRYQDKPLQHHECLVKTRRSPLHQPLRARTGVALAAAAFCVPLNRAVMFISLLQVGGRATPLFARGRQHRHQRCLTCSQCWVSERFAGWRKGPLVGRLCLVISCITGPMVQLISPSLLGDNKGYKLLITELQLLEGNHIPFRQEGMGDGGWGCGSSLGAQALLIKWS